MKYALFIMLLMPFSLKAQVKFDYSWVFGYPTDTGSNEDYNGTLLSFNSFPPALAWFDIPFALDATSAISDSSGNLLFYTNGCDIANRNHKVMANGDEINKGGLAYEQDCLGSISSTGYNYGYSTHKGALILPWPGQPQRYALFHLHKPDHVSRQFIQNLKYTVIDMSLDFGLGAVTEKNHQVFSDTFCDMLTALRHANGRDWWLVLPKYNTGRYYTFLFSPEGISAPVLHDAGSPITQEGFGVQATFSPNGKKYANMTYYDGLQVFNFDRCTGNIELVLKTREFNFGHSHACGAAFSPGSRFLYVTAGHSLYQYDMQSENLASSQRLVGEYDGYSNPLPTNFYQMMLAPDGKIYMTTSNGSKYLHAIHHPDSLGLACDFEQRAVQLMGYHAFSPPNFPHFRLYDLPGSPCDTLGINGPQPPEDTLPAPPACATEFHLWPNPASHEVLLELPACASGSIQVLDVMSCWVQDIIVQGGGSVMFDVSGYQPGVYFICWQGEGGIGVVKRLVVVR